MQLASLVELLARKTTLCLGPSCGSALVRGKNLFVTAGDVKRSIPLASIRRVILIGRRDFSLSLLHDLALADIPVEWQDHFGKCIALLWPQKAGWACLLEAQSAFCASAKAFELARSLLLAKVDNCREVLRRRVAHNADWQPLRKSIAEAENPASLRGHEGFAARFYFGHWHGLLHNFEWRGRFAHPEPDPVNMILSLGYAQLRNRLASALHHAGLEPRLGILHERRGRHGALASDLMEPLRALVDGATLSLLRRQEIAPEDFGMRGGRCVCASSRCFPRLMGMFEEMFRQKHKFYISPEKGDVFMERSVEELLDDLAESFALHVHDGSSCIIPRLAPCAGI